MMKLFYFLRGYTVIEICGASPGWALNRMAEAKVAFWDTCQLDAMTVQIKVFRGNEQKVYKLAEAAMCDCNVVISRGVFQIANKVLMRPVLTLMLVLSVVLALVLPNFVFFFQVEGNENIPDQEILRVLKDAGVGFGTYGPNIYPRGVRDKMIAQIPQVQWITVVQNGCRAKVVVREREPAPELEKRKGFSNVIASQSGIITKQSVYLGQPLCKVGDTVSKGEVLVSGVVDLERTYLLQPANAEIFARTWRNVASCIPETYAQKGEITDESHCYWIVLGGRRIKIFGNSGISYGSCDKMIATKTVTLSQGLTLPISVVKETFYQRSAEPAAMDRIEAEQILSEYTDWITTLQMRAGEILNTSQKLEECNDTYLLRSTLECHEMIAEVVTAKWNNEEFAND